MEQGDSGLLIVDKPAEWSSHDVVARVRRLLGTRKAGHAGTLDPLATGVLVVGVNRGTRLLSLFVGEDKEYTATFRLGEVSTTDDAHGQVSRVAEASHVDVEAIRLAMREFIGDIAQVPSTVSAIKVGGKRAYAAFRAGEVVELASRPVKVSRFELLDTRPTGAVLDVDVRVECSSGTYVRALARDLGRSLAVGAHVTALRRTRVGPFGLDQGQSLEELASCPQLLSLGSAASAVLPSQRVSAAQERELGHGRPILCAADCPERWAALDEVGELIAIVGGGRERAVVRPEVVFRPAGVARA